MSFSTLLFQSSQLKSGRIIYHIGCLEAESYCNHFTIYLSLADTGYVIIQEFGNTSNHSKKNSGILSFKKGVVRTCKVLKTTA